MIELYHIVELNIFFFFLTLCTELELANIFPSGSPRLAESILYAEEAAVGNVTVHFGEIIALTRNQIKQ